MHVILCVVTIGDSRNNKELLNPSINPRIDSSNVLTIYLKVNI